MQDFKKLKVWEKSHKLTIQMYHVTKTFPIEERYGLTSQIRRACSSIPTNIAEGCGRKSRADFARFLQNSMGSASELEYLIILTTDLKYIDNSQSKDIVSTVIEIKRMLTSFINKLRTDN